jgi:threonyl-tRNA synthetase
MKLKFQVFWHSTAHVLGEAMERYYGGCLCYGPPIENGFYYDMYHEVHSIFFPAFFKHFLKTLFFQGAPITPEHFKDVESIMKCAIKDKQVFERLELTKEELLEMFKYNKFKVKIVNFFDFQTKQKKTAGSNYQRKNRHADHNGIPMRPIDRSVPWSTCSQHGKNQSVCRCGIFMIYHNFS